MDQEGQVRPPEPSPASAGASTSTANTNGHSASDLDTRALADRQVGAEAMSGHSKLQATPVPEIIAAS